MFSTDLISTFSSGECAPIIVGPKEMASISGNLERIIPHSTPACIAEIFTSLLYTSLNASFETLTILDWGLGFQPLYWLRINILKSPSSRRHLTLWKYFSKEYWLEPLRR